MMNECVLKPYSVPAEKIGELAMRCALLLTGLAGAEHTPVDRVDGKATECYPSAALYRLGYWPDRIEEASDEKRSASSTP